MTCSCGCGGACGEAPTRFPIQNPSGLAQIAYRAGTFATFRRALLLALPGESELAAWQPTAGDDLGLQVVDWWAYIADVLTFYNERIANEDYLGTAALDASVAHLVSLLGYRPRPGIGAVGTLAAIASGPGPLVLPKGLAIASKATPAVPSQTFETVATTTFAQPTSVPGPTPDDLGTAPPVNGPPPAVPGAAEPAGHTQLIARGGVLVKGSPTAVAVGDRLLLMTKAWSDPDDPVVVVSVTALVPEKDPHGRKNTRIRLDGTSALPATAKAADYRLAYSTHTGHLSTLPSGATVVTNSTLVLDGPARYLKAGDPLLVTTPGAGTGGSPGDGFDVVRLTQYAEALWYANAPSASNPGTPPSGDTPGIPLVVAMLTVKASSSANLAGDYGSQVSKVAVHSGWRDVGPLLDTPVHTLTALPNRLTLAVKPAAGPGVATPALVEDANGVGASVAATPDPDSSDVTISGTDTTAKNPALQAPLRILWDLVTVSRGATVRDEVLGSGDATRPGQDFALSKAPVTFLTDFPGRSGDGYSSTVILAVGGRYWTEVPSLYGHGPDEAVFETYNDDDGRTHVRTGNGETGRRLPSGAVVSATYRVGSGSAVPAAGSLSQVLTAVPNLRSVRNPVPPAGGSDPEPAADIRRLAPRSVLTFGRAISGDDYAAEAAAAPGVTRAATAWEWDPVEQRPTVRVYVGDDSGAVANAKAALRAQADPNRPLIVVPAVGCLTALQLVLRLDPTYVAEAVYAQVRSAVLDKIFAPGVLPLGEPLYRSRIEEVVTDVPGVLATHNLLMAWIRNGFHLSAGPRFVPGDGGFFALQSQYLFLSEEVAVGDDD
jgi:hypothetical protein